MGGGHEGVGVGKSPYFPFKFTVNLKLFLKKTKKRGD